MLLENNISIKREITYIVIIIPNKTKFLCALYEIPLINDLFEYPTKMQIIPLKIISITGSIPPSIPSPVYKIWDILIDINSKAEMTIKHPIVIRNNPT